MSSTMTVSFEVFPPKTPAGFEQLAVTAERLRTVRPRYVSVTYGVGGSDRERSFGAVRVVHGAGIPVAGPLTCVGQSVTDVNSVIDRYQQLGVTRIVALRGDPHGGIDGAYQAHPDGYQRTADLVGAVAGRFDVAVSAYPERHPQSPTDDHDLDVLADKVDAGASLAITQMFFDNAPFFAFRDRAVARGIDVSIVPGVFPIHSFEAVARFAARCGATIPARIARRFDGIEGDDAATHEVSARVAAEQIAELAAHGVRHVHLYTLNRAELALAVCERLGLVEPART
jgi:methylenetetrahydrofolate reductase (NADPH)